MKSTDINISTRLGFSFGTLILIMCIIAGIGIRSLLRASEATGEIVGDRQVKVTLATATADQVNISAQNLRNAILARNQQELNLYLDHLEKNTATVGTLLARIEKTINT
ncbi:phosphoglycerate-specific signal transduction histidine kinase [Herbaspirillum sp. Sphag1AN]|uniref:MCP four helix bundle domain-containing protein n=1 Tax=unclassified Herbaspirillum TaxID=2624150 RepID=UPI001814A3C4|nr:phosphoglycerate-specific signal transduction histidine kinase [Herbaspirillum sp. Sphag1AN]MBB3245049.1 phosphoglycerate-specific signal transduction histidine kinase [Herbaspirillum sp. Sphag64]